MRVISGKYKGKRLFSPQGDTVRPTTDRIKESIFNILSSRQQIEGAVVLDLFCGSGALSIESLSRGAAVAVLVDKSPESIKLAKKNLAFVGAKDFEIYLTDYAVALRKLEGRSFDLIFLDPPYGFEKTAELFEGIAQFDILDKNGIIILEHPDKKDLPKLDDRYIIDSRKMGGTTVTFFSLKV